MIRENLINSIDHIVLVTRDMKKTIFFYQNLLGMRLEKFISIKEGEERYCLKFGTQKINLHSIECPYKPHAKNIASGTLDICFLSSITIKEWEKILAEFKIKVEEGPLERMGANGKILSIYIRDPDQNLIEISNKI